MKEKIALMTDTVANLPEKYVKENNIYVISLYVIIDGKYYKDGIDISSYDMFKLNEKYEDFTAKSASPNPNDFSEIFNNIKEDGYDKVIFIAMGSNLSSTIANAKLADDYGLDIAFIDSRTVTINQGLLVVYANDLLKKGLKFNEVVDKVNKVVGKSNAIGWIDTLKYLKAGGRLGKAAIKVSNMLNLKPFMSINGKGEFNLYKLKSTRKKSYPAVEKRLREELKDAQDYYIAYLYADDYGILDEAKLRVSDIEENALGVFEAPAGPVVAVHVGPKIYAIAYLIVD